MIKTVTLLIKMQYLCDYRFSMSNKYNLQHTAFTETKTGNYAIQLNVVHVLLNKQ